GVRGALRAPASRSCGGRRDAGGAARQQGRRASRPDRSAQAVGQFRARDGCGRHRLARRLTGGPPPLTPRFRLEPEMRLSRFFIDRPIFAAVIAVIITLVGAISYAVFRVEKKTDVVPPTFTVTAAYPGASHVTVADTVAQPIDQESHGCDGP